MSESNRGGTAAEDTIRRLILGGRLLPGQKVHQGELAAALGLSRIPVREALATLESEGLVRHRANTGYTVVVPTIDELHEIYLLRRLLETELLRSLDLATIDVAEMERCNAALAQLDPLVSFEQYREANRAFHFLLFAASSMNLVLQEATRIWTLSEFYRSLYIHEKGSGENVLHDHGEMIAAVRNGDLERLIAVSDSHRDGTERSMSLVLGVRR